MSRIIQSRRNGADYTGNASGRILTEDTSIKITFEEASVVISFATQAELTRSVLHSASGAYTIGSTIVNLNVNCVIDCIKPA